MSTQLPLEGDPAETGGFLVPQQYIEVLSWKMNGGTIVSYDLPETHSRRWKRYQSNVWQWINFRLLPNWFTDFIWRVPVDWMFKWDKKPQLTEWIDKDGVVKKTEIIK